MRIDGKDWSGVFREIRKLYPKQEIYPEPILEDKKTFENIFLGIFIGGFLVLLGSGFLYGFYSVVSPFEFSKLSLTINGFIEFGFWVGISLFLFVVGGVIFLSGFLGGWGGSLYIILYKIGLIKSWTPFTKDGNFKSLTQLYKDVVKKKNNEKE